MANDTAVNESELEREFRRDRKAGLEFLELFFRENIFRLIKSKCRNAQPNDLAEIYQDTMLRVVSAVCREDFDPCGAMRLVQVIAERACFDFMKKKKPRPVGDAREVDELLRDDLRYTKVATEWRYMLKDDVPKLRRALDMAIDELPLQQKIAAQAMMDVYEEVFDQGVYLPLRDRIQEITGKPLKTVNAYDNWRLAVEKIAQKLRRAGFNLLDEE